MKKTKTLISVLVAFMSIGLGACAPVTCNHVDDNKDHMCDKCGVKISEHVDDNHDHHCDICTEEISTHIDDNHDHLCDICGTTMSEHVDNNDDGECDYCHQRMPKVLKSIAVSGTFKTSYIVGEKFDKTGMVVTAKYADKSEDPVTNYTIAPDGPLSISDKMIVVTYEGKTEEVCY